MKKIARKAEKDLNYLNFNIKIELKQPIQAYQ
jgi:hypothetical protein